MDYGLGDTEELCEVKVLSYVQLFFDPMDFTVHEIFQARILEWVAYPFSSRSS